MTEGRTISTNKSRTNYPKFPSSAGKKNFLHSEVDHHEERFSSLKSTLQEGKCKLRRRIQSMGPICKARRKINVSSRIFEQEHEEGNEGWPNHDDDSGMWLFSGSSSPSCCTFDDKIFKNLLDFSLDDWLVSVFDLHKNSPSSPDHLSKATFLFDEILKEDDFMEEETTCWLMKSFEVDDELSYSDEDHKTFDHSLYPRKTNFGLLENMEIQGGTFDSLVKLKKRESSEWTSNDLHLNFLEIIDFPSSSYKNIWGYNISQLSDLVSSIGYAEEAEFTEVENSGNDDEPIFWPLVQKFDWRSEFSWDFLIMSPHKKMCEDEKSKGRLSEILIQNTGGDAGEKQKPWFKSALASSAKILEPQRSRDNHILTDDNYANVFIEDIEVFDKHALMLLEEDFLGVEELPIEQFIGLNEFDGLEGIDLE